MGAGGATQRAHWTARLALTIECEDELKARQLLPI